MAKLALCIGINDYPGTNSDLNGCVNDARDWGATLKARGFSVSTLLNRKATGAGIRTAIKGVLGKAKSGDLVVIQYSGHGSFVPDRDGDESDGTDECICPYDSATKSTITDDELYTLYSARAQGVRLIIISDSCHSGTVAKFAPIKTPPTIKAPHPPQRRVRFLPPASFLGKTALRQLGVRRARRKSSPPGRYAGLLFAGCQDAEYSYDAYFNGRPNGAFSFVALRALKSLGSNATYGQWFQQIKAQLPSQQYPQEPNLFGTSQMKKWRLFEDTAPKAKNGDRRQKRR